MITSELEAKFSHTFSNINFIMAFFTSTQKHFSTLVAIMNSMANRVQNLEEVQLLVHVIASRPLGNCVAAFGLSFVWNMEFFEWSD